MLLDVKQKLKISFGLYQNYMHIIDSYVSDYYVEKHWSKLPRNWQTCLENVSEDQIADLLDFKKSVTKGIFPLSLLCIRNIIVNITIPRSEISTISSNQNDEHFLKYFWKNVKLKKRHEIEKMAQFCFDTAIKSNCFYIVDIGSGLGHLSRMLSYGYGFKVCTFEANSTLSNLAKELDSKFEKNLRSKQLNHKHVQQIIHINKKIERDMDWKCFLDIVSAAFDESVGGEIRFGIVGLHPCGNLGSTLLRLFNDCPNAVFINMASCCYMKLTLEPVADSRFPLSDFCKDNNFKLSYLACEIACHAIENYVEKLRQEKDCAKLKIHAYRARLEEVLVSTDTNLKHSAVCNIKYTESLTFKQYCDKICSKLSVVPSEQLISISDNLINQTWKNIVVFYSLRLLFAPLIETIILFDRLLYSKHFNTTSEIVPLFDCNISPRNHVLSCRKCDF